MKACVVYVLIIFLLKGGSTYAQQVVRAIHFEGLKRTQPVFVKRFLSTRVGYPYDSVTVARDIQQLRNLQLFSRIEADTVMIKDGVGVTFFLSEIITLIPHLDIGTVSGNRYVQLGAIDFNWLGKGAYLGGQYRYDRYHSFQLYHELPYVKQSRWGYNVSVTKRSTLEPLYWNDLRVDYRYDNYNLELLGRYEFSFGHRMYFGGMWLHERYRRLEEIAIAPNLPVDERIGKLIFKFHYQFFRLNYYEEFISGLYQSFQTEGTLPQNEAIFFWKVVNELRLYERVGAYGNVATRLRFGISPNNMSPITPFVIDSYMNIRGVGDRIARASLETVLNLEYRHTLWKKSQWASLQGVAFVDGGSWRLPQDELFGSGSSYLFGGIGGRVQFFKAYNLVLRLDYGVNIFDTSHNGFVIGIGQYF